MWRRPKETEQRDRKAEKKKNSASVRVKFGITLFGQSTNCRLSHSCFLQNNTLFCDLVQPCLRTAITFMVSGWTGQALEDLSSMRLDFRARQIYTNRRSFEAVSLWFALYYLHCIQNLVLVSCLFSLSF